MSSVAIDSTNPSSGPELQSARSEARYRGLLEAAPDAMVVVDECGAIVLVNVQTEKQFGYPRDELIGRKVTDIIPTGFAERIIADGSRSSAEALAQDMGTGIELVALRKDGGEFPIEIMLSPLRSPEGVLITAAIRQILLNLLSNAVKFTSAGGVLLDISKIPSESSSEHLRFSISDTGSGVPEDSQSRLFEQFAQADPSISRAHGGTGLGLSICKSLVGLMGGRIGFLNNEKAGATFWFEIELETVTKIQVKPQLCADPDNRRGVRILLVEDLPMNQELACTILSRAGHFVEIAGDGIEAVAAAEENSYDLILMDIQMPRMDGVTAARKIRQLNGPARHTPIIAMTANALPEQVREFRQAGMDDYVAKPFKQQDLHEAIRRVLELPSAAEQMVRLPFGNSVIQLKSGRSACPW